MFDTKLTFEDHVRGIVSCVSRRIGIMRLVKRIFVVTSVLLHCYYEFILEILEYCSAVWGLLLIVTFSFSSVRCVRWPGFVLIRVSSRCEIDVMLLRYVCCARLIQTWITVCLVSFLLLLPEFGISKLLPQLIHWSLKYQGAERRNLHGVFCQARLECGMTLPTLWLTAKRWMGLRVQSTVGCFPELCFLHFSAAHGLLGLRNFVFPVWVCASGFNKY